MKLSWEQYRMLEGLNVSRLKDIRKSPAHYKWVQENGKKDSPAMLTGRLVHAMVFEADQLSSQFAVYPGPVRRGKDWELFKKDRADQEIVKQSEWDEAAALADAVLCNPIVSEYLKDCRFEESIQWEHCGAHYRKCKARLDAVGPQGILDLKVVRSVEPRDFGAACAKYFWHGQGAWYQNGWYAAYDEVLPYKIIGVEKEGERDVAVFNVPAEVLDVGWSECMSLLEELRKCEELEQWPGQVEGEQDLILPDYAYPDEEQVLIIGGEEVTV